MYKFKDTKLMSFRIKEVKTQSLPILDVDGGCLAQKWHHLSQQGLNLQPLPVPQSPLAGWRVLNQQSIPTLYERIPIISNGNMYQYLSYGEKQSTTFRALYGDTITGHQEELKKLRLTLIIHHIVLCGVVLSHP